LHHLFCRQLNLRAHHLAASSDRRPVDPPPVLELHVYEGEDWERAQQKDITFEYDANFFVYTTLTHARPMAHGRVQTPAATTPPILSGTPVSGLSYLDRPKAAGYFLFPDLSVRHEGRYNLEFAMYEQVKGFKQEDAEVPAPDSVNAPCGNFHYRMTIKSNDFSVFSAKKFPGLATSTTLSRTVAEQGCRVRIRRDVRMRRRPDSKAGPDNEDGEEGYSRRRRTQSPETAARARSMSNHSVDHKSSEPIMQRRPSHAADYNSQPPFGGPHSAGHMSFVGQNNLRFPQPAPPPPQEQQQHHHLPPAPIKQSSSVPASPSYPNYPPQTSFYPPPPSPITHQGYSERPLPQEIRYGQAGFDYRRPSEPEYRRDSMESVQPPRYGGYMDIDRRPTLPGFADSTPYSGRPHSDSVGSSIGSVARSFSMSSQLPIPVSQGSAAVSQARGMKITDVLSKPTVQADVKPEIIDYYTSTARGQKRHRDEREPPRLQNGQRQPEDLSRSDLITFFRANGALDNATSYEHPF
jgi:hypothetical protein